MTTTTSSPSIILIAGHWLGAWAWDEVLDHLNTDNPRAIAMTLPGLDGDDPERAAKTLDDQAAAILDVVARLGEDQPVTIVAHSGANYPVSLVLDRHPERVHRVVWVDSGPVAAGSVFAPDLPAGVEELRLPSLDVLAQQASLEGLDAEVLERFRSRAVPEPGPVLRQPVELTNDARRKVRTTLVCCSIPGAQVLELARSGHAMFAEVANIQHLDVVDLPTGHWPMWSRPRDLAEAIQSAASRTS
ncbi:alpha/beta fold hydrolase [Arthrobacter sp. zg-Y859]|uniref:Alpha/beta fold hydrolase n=1 Tax=Arthrobacter jinronghuae TaxID=2964609 RepID=A0ABT1NLJ4_9MICC|nr:alpha/beta fold hydrolase [Arthrobacter jinronghuae]MCQ1948590.1 alpha/beta fold hydrolase [Arthrobacter jinronghuae]UWX78594.1 alpha/beta fold hydrolase [Arthrobacter jinronghuae]